MKLYYVLNWDNEDPSWSDVEYASLDRTKCEDWIKNNWDSFYPGGWDEDDDIPCFIDDFDEEEIANELALRIKETDLEIDSDKGSLATAKEIIRELAKYEMQGAGCVYWKNKAEAFLKE